MASDEKPTVFINFRGVELRQSFIAHLEVALKREGVNVYIEVERWKHVDPLDLPLKGIEESEIALVIFSKGYTESSWCLNELVKIKERVEQGKLVAIPVFYKLDPSQVKNLDGDFGFNLSNLISELDKAKKWKEALDFVSRKMGLVLTQDSDESTSIVDIVDHIKRVVSRLLPDAKSDVSPNEAEVNFPGDFRKDDNLLGEATSELQQEKVGESSTMVTYNEHSPHQVFINFRGEELRDIFVSHLVMALKREGVNVYIDRVVKKGDDLENLFKRIEESTIALVIFSSRYTESRWCLDELVKIKELMGKGKLLTIPIFYKVEPSQVTKLKGEFGVKFWNLWRISRDCHVINWKEALKSVASRMDLYLKEHDPESEFITTIVKEVVENILQRGGEQPSFFPSTEKVKSTELSTRKGGTHDTYLNKRHLVGMKQRIEQLEKKLEFNCKETRIIGVVGMPGIGKTTLTMMLHEKWNCKFIRCVPLLGIRKKSEDYGLVWLRKTLLEVLLEGKSPVISDETTHGSLKAELLKTKIFAVFDDVSEKKQLEFLLGVFDWIKKGSKIVITTCDKSLLEGFAHDTYVVPELNDREAFQLFRYHAFSDQICSPTGTFLTLSRMFVDYARGNPLALSILGTELHGKDEAHWKYKLETATKNLNMMLGDVWRFSTDQLSEKQKDVFLDIVCFFKSEDEYFVRSLLDSGDPDSSGAVSEVKDLANKFLITLGNGRVEMNFPLYTISKDFSSSRWLRLWNYKDISNELKKMEKSVAYKVRGIFLNLSKVTKKIYLDSLTFINMHNLRYLKIYDSIFSGQCEVDWKLCTPDVLEFPLKEVRYLHWVKFPMEELPPDFRAENLVDLRLPYSKIERVWEGVKDTPQLKWVDLSHSSKLLNLSALSKAANLQRLNLEGCSSLDELPVDIQNMKSLVFLNLRGCIRLLSLPKMNLISLKTLILSGCTDFKEFQIISESVEVLHLDGTAIEGLPPTIRKLQKLVVLNLKNCKMFECLPNCLGELKALEELILSGCSRLKNLLDVKESLKHLQSLLIDRIGAKEMPNITCVTITEGQASADMVLKPFGPREWPLAVDRVCSLRRLCLSGNDFVSLQSNIGKLYNLSWLDVKQCKMLTSIPMLPPRLQYFDAHGCDSLQRVANPLALPLLSEQIHATFNFSNCNKLDQNAKDSIVSYTRWKSQLVLDADAVSRYNGSSVLEDFTRTCFPGWEVPAWFSHQVSGSLIKRKLPPHWCDNQITGIALCAVILLPGIYKRRNRVLVKCNCVFNNNYGSRFSCTIGSWSEPSDTPEEIGPSHVFVGYTSILAINEHIQEEDEEGCSPTEASFQFQVTDGLEEVEAWNVLECGFSLVYATDERDNSQYTKTVVVPERSENILSEEGSSGSSGIHDGTPDESYSSITLERDEKLLSEEKIDATPNPQKSFENKRVDLSDEDEAYWHHGLRRANKHFNRKLRDVWRVSIDQLTERQKDVFFDVVHFFKSSDECFVRSLLDPGNPEAVSEVRDLANKFLITISCGRVEMHEQLYTMAKDLGSPEWHRLWNYKEIIDKLTKIQPQEADNVRGIFLDMSEIKENIALECTTFADMHNLLYLKIYDSSCPRQCKADCDLYLPDGLDFPLVEVRYLHWVKFPLEELPLDFRPENLVDLRLPYSKIKRIWEGVKVTPRLKSVDLSYSSKLLDLSALSNADNLQRLNLEGCTSLDELPVVIQNMKSLVFLNLRGCIRLWSLPKMNLISLKTLILSGCSNLKEFQLISESVEFLHLDGTAIKGLPPAIQNLQRLVVLNLKNCKMLECLPDCLGSLKVLEELILSGCSKLKNVPDVRHNFKHLQILLLDGTPNISCFTGTKGPTSVDMFLQPFALYSSVREQTCGVNGVSSLRRLCLSDNDFVSLEPDIAKFHNLKWLDVRRCRKLTYVPMLPPRLQFFDAHGCESLERVANPLALLVLSEQIHATFNFSDCNKLDRDAKDSIMSYTQWRSQLVLDELTRYNGGFSMEALIGTCFPGWEVPAWFTHQASGSVLDPKLPRCVNKFIGIALCAVIAFHGKHDQRKRVLVKCNCEFKNKDGSSIHYSFNVGGWREPSNAPRKIESTHVFIGYTSNLEINTHGTEGDKEACSLTEASFDFQVTDGTKVLEGCEVLKCGFSLLYATDELQAEPGARRAPVKAQHCQAYSKKRVVISDVRGDTKTAERSPDRGCEIVEFPTKIVARGIPINPQPPEYGSGSNNSERETQVQESNVGTFSSGISLVSSSSPTEIPRSHTQIYVSFHGAKLHETFVGILVSTLTNAGFSVFTSNHSGNGVKLQQIYKKIEKSKIALVIFSKTYLDSNLCLNELVMVDKLAKEENLLVIPVFYDVRSIDVKYLEGDIGKRFKEMRERYKDDPEKVLKWETSMKSIAKTTDSGLELKINPGFKFDRKDANLVIATREAVERALAKSTEGNPEKEDIQTAARGSRMVEALVGAKIQDGYVSYPWEKRMQEALPIFGSSNFLSILFLPKDSGLRYNDLEDTLARANAWLNCSQANGVPIVFMNIQTESLFTKISGETTSATVNTTSLSDLSNLANASLYRLEDYHGVDIGVVRAVRLWFAPLGVEFPLEFKLKDGDTKLGFSISRTDEGFIYVSSVTDHEDENAPAARSGLTSLYNEAAKASRRLVVSRVGSEKVLPWMVSSTGSVRCYDSVSLSQKLSLHRQAKIHIVLHVFLWDSSSATKIALNRVQKLK